MSSKEYIFQRKKESFTQKIFEKGLDASAYVLIGLKEAGQGFLESLPNSYPQFKMMKDLFGVNGQPEFKKKTIQMNLYRLRKQGLIMKDPLKQSYCLSAQGEELVSYIKQRYSILKNDWDGKLRLVIFDIPEQKKNWRESLRKELNLMQFQLLQKSVYIGKYPLLESFCKELEKAGLTEYVFIFTVEAGSRYQEILDLFKKE